MFLADQFHGGSVLTARGKIRQVQLLGQRIPRSRKELIAPCRRGFQAVAQVNQLMRMPRVALEQIASHEDIVALVADAIRALASCESIEEGVNVPLVLVLRRQAPEHVVEFTHDS